MPQDKYGFDVDEDQHSFSTFWCCSAAFLFASFAALLVLSPGFLLFLASTGRPKLDASLTPLETFLSLHFGIILLTLAFSLLMSIPSGKSESSTSGTAVNSALLIPLSSGCLLSALLAYNAHGIGPLSQLVFVVNGLIGVSGLWTILFTEPAPRSKKSGADKHTSSVIFKNKAAASQQDKEAEKKKE